MKNYHLKLVETALSYMAINLTKPTSLFFLVSSISLVIIYYVIGWLYINTTFSWARPFFLYEVSIGLNASLFYVPVIISLIIFRNQFPLKGWLFLFIILIPRIVYYTYSPLFLFLNLLFICLPLIIFKLVTLELNWRQKEKRHLIERNKERQTFISESIKANENERQRIAQELHDGTIQTLVAIGTGIHSLQSDSCVKNNNILLNNVEWLKNTLSQAVEDLRRLTLDLRPSILDNMGLIPALRWLADNIRLNNDIDIKIIINGEPRIINSESKVTLFRIIQEALNNIVDHSKANIAWVILDYSDTTLKITIKDNGCGFIMPDNIATITSIGKLGLAGMLERANSLQVKLNINSELGVGTTITVSLLLSRICDTDKLDNETVSKLTNSRTNL